MEGPDRNDSLLRLCPGLMCFLLLILREGEAKVDLVAGLESHSGKSKPHFSGPGKARGYINTGIRGPAERHRDARLVKPWL